jgi:hypothetical protein
MYQTPYSEIVLDEADLCDLLMKGRDISDMENVIIDKNIDITVLIDMMHDPGSIETWKHPQDSGMDIGDFHAHRQSIWFMPDQYRDLDICQHVLDLCSTPDQLQRVGHELLLYQERNLFDLLRYLVYLVDTMRQHGIIWGVGRGSSVSSYVLYLLGVHRIDSMFYDLAPEEFLR